MFCSDCGTTVTGKFCSACGARVALPVETVPLHADEPTGDWSQWSDYEALIAHPAVRERLAAAAVNSTKRLSGEQFLEVYSKVLNAVTGTALPLAALAKIAQPLHAKLGVKTGKSRQIATRFPIGEAIVTSLCWLAHSGRTLQSVQQLPDGCLLLAELPSDLFALAGELSLTVARTTTGALVTAATHIPGQMFDWGKSNRCLDELAVALASRIAA